MNLTAKEVAQLINGQLEGNPDVLIHTLSKIEEAEKGAVSFISNDKYLPFAYSTNASVLIVNQEQHFKQAVKATLIRVENSYIAFTRLLELYAKTTISPSSGIHPTAYIHPSAKIGKAVTIEAFVYIGKNGYIGDGARIAAHSYIGNDAKIGVNCHLYAGVKVYHQCEIGDNCIIHAGTIIGSDGFGFAPQKDGSLRKIPQVGKVIIENAVEIGANCCIDRATMGATIIREGAKLDNLIQVAHNVEIGAHTVIAAQAGISGSTQIGKHCMIGGQAGFVGHIKLADGTKVNAQSGVSKSIKETGQALTGSPAWNFRDHLRSQAIFRKLPQLVKRLGDLEKKVRGLLGE